MGPEGLSKQSEGLPEGPGGLPEGPEGLPEGPEGLPEGLEGLPGGPWGGTDVWTDGWTDGVSPHSTGLCSQLGPLPCYLRQPLRLHQLALRPLLLALRPLV